MFEPYTANEMRADFVAWAQASPIQRGDAFDQLLGVAVTLAHRGDPTLAQVLRNLRLNQDQFDRINGTCRWCREPMSVPDRPQGGGRTKRFCSPACKQAAHRFVEHRSTTGRVPRASR